MCIVPVSYWRRSHNCIGFSRISQPCIRGSVLRRCSLVWHLLNSVWCLSGKHFGNGLSIVRTYIIRRIVISFTLLFVPYVNFLKRIVCYYPFPSLLLYLRLSLKVYRAVFSFPTSTLSVWMLEKASAELSLTLLVFPIQCTSGMYIHEMSCVETIYELLLSFCRRK